MPGGILISHETWSLVRDAIVAEEQEPMQVKGLARPVRNYRMLVDTTEPSTRPVIREEQAGFKLFLDLQESDRTAVSEALEKALSLIRR
jgi:hypothetical protein